MKKTLLLVLCALLLCGCGKSEAVKSVEEEIASLLGETAAETKIALAKLKESIQDE